MVDGSRRVGMRVGIFSAIKYESVEEIQTRLKGAWTSTRRGREHCLNTSLRDGEAVVLSSHRSSRRMAKKHKTREECRGPLHEGDGMSGNLGERDSGMKVGFL